MTIRLGLIGERALIELHGVEGVFGWGEVRVLPADAFEPDVAFGVGQVPVRDRDLFAKFGQRAVWNATPVKALDATPTLAPGGEALWRIAPLPVADALFAMDRPGRSGVLVVGGEPQDRDAAADRLSEHRHDVRSSAELTQAELSWAGVVAVLPSADGSLSEFALPVLASGRLLLAPQASPGFGVTPGVDYLVHENLDELTKLADAAVGFPGIFDHVTAMGRAAAHAQRASVVYGRIAADLVADFTAPRRSAEPRG